MTNSCVFFFIGSLQYSLIEDGVLNLEVAVMSKPVENIMKFVRQFEARNVNVRALGIKMNLKSSQYIKSSKKQKRSNK